MSYENEIRPQGKSNTQKRPKVTSYDSCHEHSIEHWVEVRHLVEGVQEENTGAQPRIIAPGRKPNNGT
jgi:hypothetical protein